jgi:hypothetical protein
MFIVSKCWRARLELSCVKALFRCSTLGRLLALPANIRLGRKGLQCLKRPMDKRSSLFGPFISNVCRTLYNIEAIPNVRQMEQQALKNGNNCLNTNIYSYLETSVGQISNLYLNVVHFFNTSVY